LVSPCVLHLYHVTHSALAPFAGWYGQWSVSNRHHGKNICCCGMEEWFMQRLIVLCLLSSGWQNNLGPAYLPAEMYLGVLLRWWIDRRKDFFSITGSKCFLSQPSYSIWNLKEYPVRVWHDCWREGMWATEKDWDCEKEQDGRRGLRSPCAKNLRGIPRQQLEQKAGWQAQLVHVDGECLFNCKAGISWSGLAPSTLLPFLQVPPWHPCTLSYTGTNSCRPLAASTNIWEIYLGKIIEKNPICLGKSCLQTVLN